MENDEITNNENMKEVLEPEKKDKFRIIKNNKTILLVVVMCFLNVLLFLTSIFNNIVGILDFAIIIILFKITYNNDDDELHTPAEIFVDSLDKGINREQFGIPNLNEIERINKVAGRPNMRIQTINMDFILFMWNDNQHKPVAMLSKKIYKEQECPLLSLYTTEIVDMNVPEIIRIAERDLYGQRNRELRIKENYYKDNNRKQDKRS